MELIDKAFLAGFSKEAENDFGFDEDFQLGLGDGVDFESAANYSLDDVFEDNELPELPQGNMEFKSLDDMVYNETDIK